MKVNKQKLLTPRQKKVLDYIKKFKERKGYSPTLNEIANYLRKSLSTAQHYVEELKNRGFLKKSENMARGITPVEETQRILLLGYIAAGKPIEPIENPEPINIPVSMINKAGNYYALKVKGNSMIDDGIADGDIAVIQHMITANNGDTVVAITEKGATLKVLRKQKGLIFLEPRNRKLKNIYPKELEIRGKFCGLIRRE
ncbi:repressor LexA [bacterium (Candidatus Gribaldobacteria) CG_4_10_14_0_8_um_filter_33_9]|uniref:Repressor LexA n=1 Tax=bacterium (Candidatus Gribaldobacteria) CG_4_10_14_0_8_um_filter_33_9 TaxID=2014266 RepID=A0A2M7RPJ1_9BACT|nr:MAG: repressor LexA [bacterium (Candidatus Gribaldobacteria) CG_4_10_14_0_8_um_filter_33_9]